ncbi:MAG TPA: RIP metalloprotease RseP [Gammaproteobacteria bacterium]
MIDVALSLVAFIVAIGVLVSVHELGHFWVARRLGFKVLRFSVGFGKPLYRLRGRDPDRIEYWISSIPLGGYVKMLDEREAPVPEAERHRAFNNRPPAQRIAVLLAGPGFNFVFAVLAYWLLFMTGVPGMKAYVAEITPGSAADDAGLRPADVIEAVDGQPTETWEQATLAILDEMLDDGVLDLTVRGANGNVRNVDIDVRGRVEELTEPDALFDGLGLYPFPAWPAEVGTVTPGGPADRAGLEPGDRVLAVDGRRVSGFNGLASLIRARPGETVDLLVERDGREIVLPVTIGVAGGDGEIVNMVGRDRARPADENPPSPERARTGSDGEAVGQIGITRIAEPPHEWDELAERLRAEQRYGPLAALGHGIRKTWEMSALTVTMIGHMVVGDVSMRNMSGPIAIAGYAGDSAQAGFSAFLSFLAIVSISLGILNLLPVPLLDGGQIVYQLAEWIKGAPLSERAMAFGQQLGILFMILLMGFVFYNDLTRVFG